MDRRRPTQQGRRPPVTLLAGIVAVALAAAVGRPLSAHESKPAPFVLKDGDRVVFVGDGFVEREQKYAILETALACRWPEVKFTFRNLGWSGDTADGLSRAYFDPPAAGRQRLVEQIQAEKPTVLFVSFCQATVLEDDFDADRAVKSLTTLIDQAAPQADRVVVIIPPVHAAFGTAAGSEVARRLRQLADRSSKSGDGRTFRTVDLADASFGKRLSIEVDEQGASRAFEPDRVHLTERGYTLAVLAVEQRLGLAESHPCLVIDASGKMSDEQAFAVDDLKAAANAIVFRCRPTRLTPFGEQFTLSWTWSHGPGEGSRVSMIPGRRQPILAFEGLSAGAYALTVDGRGRVESAADEWSRPGFVLGKKLIELLDGREQRERLQAAIRRKDYLFFHSYRPTNITYLLGFRKYEQGQNAGEVDQLRAQAAAMQSEIDRLRVPEWHTVELRRVADAPAK